MFCPSVLIVDPIDWELHEWYQYERWCFRVPSEQYKQGKFYTFIIINEISVATQLVDTKSAHNTTLLHFLERVVVKHFPEMEDFMEELAKPAEAYRGT